MIVGESNAEIYARFDVFTAESGECLHEFGIMLCTGEEKDGSFTNVILSSVKVKAWITDMFGTNESRAYIPRFLRLVRL